MTRNEAITEVAAHIAPFIKPDLDARSIAAELIDNKDAASGDEISVEVPGRYTLNGNPFISTTEKPEDE
jgi:hypothetical protein